MPRSVYQAGLADTILPLPQIIPEMLYRLAATSPKKSFAAKSGCMVEEKH
jgi:chemotaxis response regulator CheB